MHPMKYRMLVLHSTDPRRLDKKKGTRKDASIYEMIMEGRWIEGIGWESR